MVVVEELYCTNLCSMVSSSSSATAVSIRGGAMASSLSGNDRIEQRFSKCEARLPWSQRASGEAQREKKITRNSEI